MAPVKTFEHQGRAAGVRRDREAALCPDFAIYCANGKIDVETDGDLWRANPERAAEDSLRDNDLETGGWRILRFNTPPIREQMETYCLPMVLENIHRLGGVDERRIVPRHIGIDALDGVRQLGLFDDL